MDHFNPTQSHWFSTCDPENTGSILVILALVGLHDPTHDSDNHAHNQFGPKIVKWLQIDCNIDKI